MYSCYVLGFAVAVGLPEGGPAGLLFPVASGAGGVAAGLLWTSQGAIFAAAAAEVTERARACSYKLAGEPHK